MRDTETIELAITAAEMGTLVFGTLHTNSATKTIDRLIDAFPASRQNQVRNTLAESHVFFFHGLLTRLSAHRIKTHTRLLPLLVASKKTNLTVTKYDTLPTIQNIFRAYEFLRLSETARVFIQNNQ